MATNWDEAGREATSPENDYTNNEVAYHLATLAHYSRTTYLLATLSPSRRAQSPLTPSAHWLLMATRYSSLYLPLHPTPYTLLPTPYTTPTPYLHQANVAIKIEGEHVTALSTAQVHQQCPHDSVGARHAD